MELLVYNNSHDLALAVVHRTIDILKDLVVKQKQFSVAISGGNTPVEFYKLLTKQPYIDQIPWKNTHIFWCDERCVGFDDPGSNYGQFSHIVLNKIDIPAKNIHPIDCSRGSEEAVRDYTRVLSNHATQGREFPIFDIVYLGLGEDGHTASLFPGEISTHEINNPVISSLANYQNRPAPRVSLTPLIINQAKNIFFIVTGANKAEILSQVINGPTDQKRFPAQRIFSGKGNIVWIADKLAAGETDKEINAS